MSHMDLVGSLGSFTAGSAKMTTKKLILLAEDNRDVADIMTYALHLLGYEAVVAIDGVEVLEKAIGLRPDLIIMDMVMPKLDGFQATSQLRQHPDTRHIPILAATALATVEDRKRCFTIGCDEVILKPFTPKDLAPVIEKLLQRASGNEPKRAPQPFRRQGAGGSRRS